MRTLLILSRSSKVIEAHANFTALTEGGCFAHFMMGELRGRNSYSRFEQAKSAECGLKRVAP
jgi:hypothetical protein